MPQTRIRRDAALHESRRARRPWRPAAWLGLLALAGCAVYTPQALNPAPAARDARHTGVTPDRMPLPVLRHHRFDPADGLDVTETAMLAVADNPQLKLLRDRLGVRHAQAFAAGLLPDPHFTASRDVPTGSGPGLTRGYSQGLGMDLGPLLTRPARKAAAHAREDQARLQLLWAEWQTIARARLLFDRVQSLRQRRHLLLRERTAVGRISAPLDAALKDGNLDYASASAGLDAVAGVRTQLGDTTRQLDDAEHALRLLLGLAPQAPLHLAGPPWQTSPTPAQIRQAERHLVQRRPDLRALQRGYAAQEASVRAAILGQFPDIQVGFNRASDTSNVHTRGFSIDISLPLFDGNRGAIAVARATRRELADDYRARLLATRNDMHRLQQALQTLDPQISAARTHARQLDAARQAADANWRDGRLDWPTWLAIRASALNADLQLDALEQQRARASITLETLLGGDWSDADTAQAHVTNTAERSP